MKTRLAIVVTILAASAAGAGAGDIISLPTAAISQQGKTSRFKHFVKMETNITLKGKSLPIAMNLAVFQTQKYGYMNNGWIPITTSIALGNLGGAIDGKSITSQMPKNFKYPKLPTVTSYVTKTGKVAKVKVTNPVTGKSKSALIAPDMDAISKSMMDFLPPSGTLELGVPIRRDLTLPLPGAKVSGQVSFVPLQVSEAGGEPVVEILIDGDGSMDGQADLGKVALGLGKSAGISTAKALPKLDIAGNGNMIVNGTMLIGLNSGEPVRQDIKITAFADIAMMGQTISGDIDLTIGGYRMSNTTKVAKR